MRIEAAKSVQQLVAEGDYAARLIAHPQAAELRAVSPAVRSVIVAVGPEGGFTDQEVDMATAAGWKAVGLGPRTLRVETAALAMIARLAG